MEFNIYCDESCHLEHDRQTVMVFGAIWCPKGEASRIAKDIKAIKAKHRVLSEIKWKKVSQSKSDFFLEIVDYFFAEPQLHFRCLVVDDKSKLNHESYNLGSHDLFYSKMYFYMLRNIINPRNPYCIYLDIKDTQSDAKIVKLHEVLGNYFHDGGNRIIMHAQQIRSHESNLLQLADLFIGAIGYQNRGLTTNFGKLEVIARIATRSGQSLCKSTPPWEDKFNIFIFSPREL